MNKYKKSFNKIKVNDDTLKKILLKIKHKEKKNYLIPVAFATFILFFSIGIVNASKYLYTTKSKSSFKNGIHEVVLEKAKTKTNWDNYNQTNLELEYKDLTISEIESLLGIELLTFEGNKMQKANVYPCGAKEITQISIDYGKIYIERNDEYQNKEKSIYLFSIIYTTNANLEDTEYDNTNNDNTDFEFIGDVELESLNTKGFIIKYEYLESDGWNNATKGTKVCTLKFSYNGIVYALQGNNLSKEELLEYANKLQ